MVNAQEWINNSIENKEEVKHLYIYQQENNNYNYTYNNPPSTYYFYNTLLEGELDLNDFINLEQLIISGIGNGHNQQQEITSLKIDKCSKLTTSNINYTTLSNLNAGKNIALQSLNCSNNRLGALNLSSNSSLHTLNYENNPLTDLDINNTKLTKVDRNNKINLYNSRTENQLKRDKEQFQSQVKRLIEVILTSENLDQLKQEAKKIELENLTYQLNDKKAELGKFLSKTLNGEEIKLLLDKQKEIINLENKLYNLRVQKAQIEIPPK